MREILPASPTRFRFQLNGVRIFIGGLIILGLYLSSLYSYELFHTLIEVTTITIGWCLFLIVWNTHDWTNNRYLLVLGTALAASAGLDLMHTLAYKGLNLFPGYDSNLPTQLWIAARFLQSLSMFLGLYFLKSHENPSTPTERNGQRKSHLSFATSVVLFYSVIVTGLLILIFLDFFPVCYIEGQGLTPFKNFSEYIISIILLSSLVWLWQKRQYLDRTLLYYLMAATIVSAFTELAFTFYISVNDLSNLIGHFGKLTAYYLIYLAVIQNALKHPYGVLFRDLVQKTTTLRESEEKYRLLVENANDIVYSISTDGIVNYVSPVWERVLGYSASEILNRPFYPLIHPDDLPVLNELFEKLAQKGECHSDFEYRILHKQGMWRWHLTSASVIRNDEGKVVSIIGVARDITDHKQTELIRAARLRLLEIASKHSLTELLQATLDECEELTGSQTGFYHFVDSDQQSLTLQAWSTNTVDHLCKIDRVGRHYSVNEAGVWVDCVRERRPVIHNDYNALSHRKGLPEGHAPMVRELVVPVIRSGLIVAVLGVGNKPTLYNEQDVQVILLMADLAWDIAERKRTEEHMQLLSEMLDIAPNAITIHDTQGDCLYANQKCFELHGYSPEEFTATNLHQLEVPENEALFAQRINQIHAEGTAQFETAHFRKDGSIVPVEVFAKKVNWQKRPCLLSIATDITERKIAEKELKRRQALLEAAANVSNMLLKTHSTQDTLNNIVGILGEASGQDRAYYFSWNAHPDRDDEVTISLLNEWVQNGIPTLLNNPAMQKIPFSDIAPYSYRQLWKGGIINALAEELPASERKFLDSRGMISILLVPVMIDNKPRGLIGFDNCHSRCIWNAEAKNILIIVADNIANAFVRWETEEMIRSSNETAQAILNSATESVFLMDLEGNVITANHTTAQRLGIETNDLIGANIYNYLPSEISQSRKRQVEQLIRTGQPSLFEDERSGRWFENSIYPVFDQSGKIIQVAIYGRDISERKLAEKQMQTTQKELTQLLTEAERSRQAMLSLIEDQKEAEDQVRLINTELEQRVKDRTAQLEIANKELEAFSYSVSHDLRAPLRALDGFSSALIQDYGNTLDEKANHYITRIQEASQRMKQLIEDLLDLSRISRQNMTLSRVNLSYLAEQLCDSLELEFSNLDVEKRITPDLIVKADQNLMRIALENLLHNAFKYSSKQQKASIELGMLEQNEEPVYYVRDNGAGFDMAYADKLFTPFQRLHGAKEFTGTGIGLTIVQRIITRHGGRIWAEAGVNEGATFYFTIGGE